MKKTLISVVIVVFLLAGLAWAADLTRGSGAKTASASIAVGYGSFAGAAVATDGTNAVGLSFYDTAYSEAIGDKLFPTVIITSSSIDRIQILRTPFGPVQFASGCYVSASSAGTFSYVGYVGQ